MVFILALISAPLFGGTWNDHFSSTNLAPAWTGNREAFQILKSELQGGSATPVAPSPLNFVEIATDSTDCSVGAWINVWEPNLHVCTKGALLARHSGTNGYVFALHEATQTAEIYRLATHEMLLSKSWAIQLKNWYYARAELHGPTMNFYIDGELVGTVTDSETPSGAVGLAVQDADAVYFDDFSVSGPNVVGNVDNIPKPHAGSVEQTNGNMVFRFTAEPPYDYNVQVRSGASPTPDWQTIASYRAKAESFQAVVTDSTTNALRFYRIEKVPCDCR